MGEGRLSPERRRRTSGGVEEGLILLAGHLGPGQPEGGDPHLVARVLVVPGPASHPEAAPREVDPVGDHALSIARPRPGGQGAVDQLTWDTRGCTSAGIRYRAGNS